MSESSSIDPDETVSSGKLQMKRHGKRLHLVRGEWLTATMIAVRYGLDYGMVAKRVRQGIEGDALAAPLAKKVKVSEKGLPIATPAQVAEFKASGKRHLSPHEFRHQKAVWAGTHGGMKYPEWSKLNPPLYPGEDSGPDDEPDQGEHAEDE